MKSTHFVEPPECNCNTVLDAEGKAKKDEDYKYKVEIDVKGDSVDKMLFYRYFR